MRKKTRKKLKEAKAAAALIEKLELTHASRVTWRDEFAMHKDNTVREATVLGLLEFVPGKEREQFMDELYRVLVPEGKATVIVAYWNTMTGVQDYLYEWPPLCEQSFLFFNKGWREAQKLTDRGLTCDFDFCVSPETLVLTADLRWIRADEIKISDSLVGVEEFPAEGDHRRMLSSTVEFTRSFAWVRRKVITDYGNVITTPQHPFLTRRGNLKSLWVAAERLKAGDKIKFTGTPWTEDRSDSWLSGIYDGEGCIVLPKRKDRYSGLNLTISQNPGLISDKSRAILESELGPGKVNLYDKAKGTNCKTLCVCGISETLQVLGIYRPIRLLSKIKEILGSGRLGLPNKLATVLAVEELEEGPVVAIRTSTRTLVTNGFVSHNTYGYAPTAETAAKSDETRSFAIRCYNNAVQNLQLVLTKRPVPPNGGTS